MKFQNYKKLFNVFTKKLNEFDLNSFLENIKNLKIDDLKNRPEALNLINIYSFVTNKSLENTLASMAGKDFSKLKKELSDVLVATICPIGKKIKELKKDERYLIDILKKGSNKAHEIAKININKVKDIVGFISH